MLYNSYIYIYIYIYILNIYPNDRYLYTIYMLIPYTSLLSCKSSPVYRYLLDGACRIECPPMMYPHIDEHDGHRSCQKCHILCANCTGPGSGNCTSCNENGREENGNCQPICGKQYVIIILSLNEWCAKIIVMLCWLSSTVHVAKRFFNGLLKRSNCVALDASGTFSMILNVIYVSQNHLAWFCCKIEQTCNP